MVGGCLFSTEKVDVGLKHYLKWDRKNYKQYSVHYVVLKTRNSGPLIIVYLSMSCI